MSNGTLNVVLSEDQASVCQEDLRSTFRRPLARLLDGRLDVLDHPAGSANRVRHPKSPRAAWPSTSRTSTGAPTCSLIFMASDGPIAGSRERSFGLAFWRSRRVRNPR